MYSAVFSLVIWPHELLLMHFMLDLEVDLIKGMLAYVGTVASTAIGGYIWSAMKDDVGVKDVVNAFKRGRD